MEARQEQSIKTELESMAANLINSSNVFVTNLGQTTERNSQNLTLLTVVGSKTNGYENISKIK